MHYVNFGQTGLKVSRLCLGCMTYGDPNRGAHAWTLPEAESRPFINAALDHGINFFDTANVYSLGSSEEILGRAIRDFAPRDELVIATKVHGAMREKDPNGRGLSRKAILTEIDNSLKRLGLDYVDLYQIHRFDHETPIYIGASSMAAWQFVKANYLARLNGWTRLVSMQNHVNLLYREEEREMIPYCQEDGIAVIPWSPLARGRLTRPASAYNTTKRADTDQYGKTLYDGAEQSDEAILAAVERIAKQRGVPMAQVALAWLLAQPGITAPIIGASKPHHLDDAIAALDLKLTQEELDALSSPYVPRRIAGF
jgi:aryl-alcohol dehydrogenase-like predicted oxidoreductase